MWHFCLRAPLKADRVLLQTNSKKYFRKITALLTVKTVLSHFITFKEHMPNKADTTRLRSRTQNTSFLTSIFTLILKLVVQIASIFS